MSRASSFVCLFLLLTLVHAGNLSGQSISMNDLPGWDRVQASMNDGNQFTPANITITQWDSDGGKLYFSTRKRGSEPVHSVLNLATGELEQTDEPPSVAGDNGGNDRRRMRAGVGRARQRLWIKSADERLRATYKDYNLVLEHLNEEGEVVGDPVQVTTTGTEKHRFGTACWVYGEELDQQDAMWFSPDSKYLAFYEIDESHMKTYYLTTGNSDLYTGLHKEQYPTAGQDNPHVKLHIYNVENGQTVAVQVDGPVDQYIYDIQFSPDGQELIFHRTNRWQNKLDVMAAHVETGKTRTIVSESQDTWQNNSPLMRFLEDGQTFIWETERTGWKQYQLRHMNGDLISTLTPDAEYPVHQVVQIDPEEGWFYYSAYSDTNPLNLQLHRARLDGSNNQKLTTESVHHSNFRISPNHDYFVVTGETISTPPVTSVWKIDAKGSSKILALNEQDPDVLAKAGYQPGEVFHFKADDGVTDVYGTLYKPRDFDPERKYPLLIDVYGGPHSVGVTNRFRASNPFCEMGFIIAKIGNRGTVNRGKAFESANYMKLGIVDMDDQAAGVRYLAQRDYIDGDRVGISGHSYGGYMSALALLRYPDLFHVGVSGAPVTDWKNYDTIYTERYMRTPKENPDGYLDGSCLKKEHVNNLEGKLFILHGLVDDNVHPSNTWQLVDALQKAGKRFDLMVYPNSAHGFRYNELKWDYFIRHLQPELPARQLQTDDN